ncbi:GNAT family N-acetyltransferase [Sabulilitoribacter multivorans]|uniref:GNAT family N-acetyltransferase n=1 Tax=Flaviramulus multivorans TaxID=1304750 RepID=A0ABS9IJM6_9FLAO|nr:GNAT family N-acetyltransferase [Flaviramulus multivorans]MCF7560791.1 GNAT family N-acetyltransferase [Flaviramulus multivorans]
MPYLQDPFKTIWLNHFNDGEEPVLFSFVEKLAFVKHKKLPVYFNIGKTNTKGIDYKLSSKILDDYKNKIFIIYDVQKAEVESLHDNNKLSYYKIQQYPGYICGLSNHKNLNDYMLKELSRKSRYKFNSYKRKLESSYNISYKMYIDDITPELYDVLFIKFKTLLKKRFFDKKTINNNLNPDEWSFYKEVSFSMMKNRQAGIFVVYNGEIPIAITLLNFCNNTMFDVIRTFDIAFAKYRLGTVSIMAQIEWCINNNIKFLDFSKGYFEYKERWANKPYWFEYHIYYDRNSFTSKALARFFKIFFEFKLFLRKKHLTNLIHEIKFILNKKKYAG